MNLKEIALTPLKICETRAGNFAHTVGRLAFRTGRPMLVEHACGTFLEHALCGRVTTPGYGAEFDIVAVYEEFP